MSRDDAYRVTQRLAQQAYDTRTQLRDLLADYAVDRGLVPRRSPETSTPAADDRGSAR